jgi:hypothetical protein
MGLRIPLPTKKAPFRKGKLLFILKKSVFSIGYPLQGYFFIEKSLAFLV